MTTSPEIDQKKAERKLPAGWRWVRLGEVCDILNGFAFDGSRFSRTKGTPLIRIRDLKTNSPSEHFDGDFDPSYLIQPGSCLVGMDGEFLCYRWQGPTALLNQRVCHLLPKAEALSPDFLFFALNDYLKEIQKDTAYTTVKHISSGQILGIQIALPSLNEQKRIAAILTEQITAVEQARAAAEAQLEAAKALSAAHLRAVFNSPEAQRWSVKKLGDVGEIVSGVTLGRKTNGMQSRSVPYLRVANVKDSHLDLSNVYQIEATEDEIRKLRLQFGDILLTEGGDPDKLGRGMFWENQIPECIHQNHIFRVRFNPDELLPPFVSAQIGSSYGKTYFLAHAKQTTGIATINQKVLADFPLMVPPLSEQRRIGARVAEQMAVGGQARKMLEAQLGAINALPAALLRRVLSGEL